MKEVSIMTTSASSQPATPKRAQKMVTSQNVEHLLNFTLPPRQPRPPVNLPRRSRKTGTNQGIWNKERFVNAQYRFVMDPTGDYTVHFADPDIFFQWHDILQIIVPRSALASVTSTRTQEGHAEGNTYCPICLSPPSAPRMTKCGHVFCFPCILHYLSTSENKWARCPICFDSVNEKQLKSIKWYDGSPQTEEVPDTNHASSSSSTLDEGSSDYTPRPGTTLVMRLVQRPQITTLALPRSPSWPSDLLPPHQAPFHFLPDVFSFAKFMLATPEFLMADLSKDLDELAAERRSLAAMDDSLGLSFIDGAALKIRSQIARSAALETPVLLEQINKALRIKHEIAERAALHDRCRKAGETASPESLDFPEEYVALKSVGSAQTALSHVSDGRPRTPSRSAPKQRRNVNPPPPSTSAYYYYQAASGLPIFLHPLDIKILLAHFKSYSSFPNAITIRVESLAEGTVNDDLRKRCKYLAHMPEGADVVFIEADLSDVVGTEGLKNFEGALKMRTSRRKEKGRRDERARTRAEEREREKVLSSWPNTEAPRAPTPPPFEENEGPTGDAPPTPVLSTAGAWGARSFASALHSTPPSVNNRSQRHDQASSVDEWDVDAAWHELERNAGGRKKRGARLVLLGSGGGGARRR